VALEEAKRSKGEYGYGGRGRNGHGHRRWDDVVEELEGAREGVGWRKEEKSRGGQ